MKINYDLNKRIGDRRHAWIGHTERNKSEIFVKQVFECGANGKELYKYL